MNNKGCILLFFFFNPDSTTHIAVLNCLIFTECLLSVALSGDCKYFKSVQRGKAQQLSPGRIPCLKGSNVKLQFYFGRVLSGIWSCQMCSGEAVSPGIHSLELGIIRHTKMSGSRGLIGEKEAESLLGRNMILESDVS